MTREEIIALAKQHGASAYTSRHYPDETYVTFPPEKLEAFFHAAQRLEREKNERLFECAERLVSHADFKLGGVLSADSKAKDIPSGAVSQVKARHLAALRDAIRNRTAS